MQSLCFHPKIEGIDCWLFLLFISYSGFCSTGFFAVGICNYPIMKHVLSSRWINGLLYWATVTCTPGHFCGWPCPLSRVRKYSGYIDAMTNQYITMSCHANKEKYVFPSYCTGLSSILCCTSTAFFCVLYFTKHLAEGRGNLLLALASSIVSTNIADVQDWFKTSIYVAWLGLMLNMVNRLHCWTCLAPSLHVMTYQCQATCQRYIAKLHRQGT